LYTDLQTAYENLRRTQHVVLQQEQLRALGQMASGIAHDINNAISPIALYSESLMEREAGLSKQGQVQLQTIQRAIADVAATVARMREFYRAREPQLSLSPVQLNELVPQVVELTKARWSTQPQEHGITIEQRTELQRGLPAISGAANEIREALTNLVFNAVDAMPEGGTLTLRTSRAEDGRVQLEVCDTGIGMDEDSRRRCLEPFFTTKGERGTGLGLAMVYGMAQRHSADLDIESAPGKGTCVRLVFRAADAVQPVVDVPPVIATERQHILIVDDDPVLLRALSEILREEGHTVVTANGGRQGIDLARAALADKQPFTVVITDLGMPHVDGRQVARELKALAPELPVILLTGWGQRLAVEGDVPPDVAMVLSKPPKLRDIREALARCCGEKSSVTA
jgi:CheY-like chemotaxis protein